MRRSRTIQVAAILAATAALVLSGCSSSKSGGGSSSGGSSGAGSSAGGGGSPTNVRGVTSTSIKIAGDISETIGGGPTGNADADLGAKARFYEANQAGGINGRMINYTGSLDDGASAATLLTNMRKQVLNDKVYAISPFVTYAAPNVDFVSQQKVPVIGSIFNFAACGSNWFYSNGGCIENPTFAETTSVAAIAQYMTNTPPDAKTGAISAPAASSSPPPAGNSYAVITSSNLAQIIPTLQVAAKHVGWASCLLNATVPPAGVTDFSSYAVNVMHSCGNGKGPSVMLFVLPTAQYNASMIEALRGLGWKGQAEIAGYDPVSLKSAQLASTLQGAIYYDDGIGFEGSDNTATYDQIRKALTGIGQDGHEITQGILTGWQGADLTVAALQKVGKDLSPDNFDKTINGGSGWTKPAVPGFMAALSFPLAHTHPAPCYNIAKVVGTKLQQVSSFVCAQVLNKDTGAVVSGGPQ